jgi:hypothetical protein
MRARRTCSSRPSGRTDVRAISVMLIRRLAPLAVAALAFAPKPAFAQGDRYAVIVEGVSGDESYAKLYRGWVDRISQVLKQKAGMDAAHLSLIVETPGAGEQKATAEVVKATFAKLARQLKPEDQLFVMLIGHGGSTGGDAKFNLVGPDLTTQDWADALKPVAGHVAFVDTSSASFGFIQALAAPGRVVITATNSNAQVYDTVFAEGFIAAFSTSEADTDKDGRTSLMEAFTYARRKVDEHFQQAGTLATEHAVFDDTGQGAAHDTAVANGAGAVASLTFLEVAARPTSSDPAVQALIDRQQQLTQQVDELRRKRPSMPPQTFDEQFEPLIIELATVSRDIRRKAGGIR